MISSPNSYQTVSKDSPDDTPTPRNDIDLEQQRAVVQLAGQDRTPTDRFTYTVNALNLILAFPLYMSNDMSQWVFIATTLASSLGAYCRAERREYVEEFRADVQGNRDATPNSNVKNYGVAAKLLFLGAALAFCSELQSTDVFRGGLPNAAIFFALTLNIALEFKLNTSVEVEDSGLSNTPRPE